MPYKADLSEKSGAVEVRSALKGAGEYLRELHLKTDTSEGHDADVRSAVRFINDWDHVLTALEHGEERAAGGAGPRAATANVGGEIRTAGDAVVANADFQAFQASGNSRSTHHAMELRGSLFANSEQARMSDAEFRADVTSTIGASWKPLGNPSDTPPVVRRRRLFVRDLLNVQGTNLGSVPYIRESHPSTDDTDVPSTGAGSTAEGTAKTEVTMGWAQDDAPARKITAWIPATTEIIEDAPSIRGQIDNRLAYLLALREEMQIIVGNGTAPQLRGILAFAGLQSQAYVGTDPMRTIGLAIGLLEAVDGEANGIAIHPTDYWQIVTTRQANQFEGSSGGGYAGPFAVAPGDLWGVPTIRSRSVPVTEPIVGDWAMGATLFDRMSTTIAVGNQHSDYFTTNKVAIVAEERVALAVHRPDYFVRVLLHV